MDNDISIKFADRELVRALFFLAQALLSKLVHRFSGCLLALNFKLLNLRHQSQRIKRHHLRAAGNYLEIDH